MKIVDLYNKGFIKQFELDILTYLMQQAVGRTSYKIIATAIKLSALTVARLMCRLRELSLISYDTPNNETQLFDYVVKATAGNFEGEPVIYDP